MNLFDDLWGEDFFGAGEEKKADKKSPAKKTEEKKGEKTAKSKAPQKGTDFECALPVTVKGRNFTVTVDGTGTMKASALKGRLAEMGYLQFQIPEFRLFHIQALPGVVFADDGLCSVAEPDDSQAFDEERNPVTVCDGSLQCVLQTEDFPEIGDPEDISVKDIAGRWVAVNPQYQGCGLYLDRERNIFYPVLKNCYGEHHLDRLEINVFGETRDVDLDGHETFDKAAREIAGDLATATACIKQSDNAYFLAVNAGKEQSFGGGAGAKHTAVKKVEEKYPLPMDLYVVNWNAHYELTDAMFGGKAKITKEEITREMAKVEKLFADTDRKVDYFWSQERSCMSAMFVSGKKG